MQAKNIKVAGSIKQASRFEHLPKDIQIKIKQLLIMNDFRSAKALYDKYLI